MYMCMLLLCVVTIWHVEASVEDHESMEDLDGESVLLCRQCHLPLGELAYAGDNSGLVHGECMAQVMLLELKEKEEEHQSKEAELKLSRREKYDIGWRIQHVPKNLGPLGKLGIKEIKGGSCCIVLDPATHSVGLAPPSTRRRPSTWSTSRWPSSAVSPRATSRSSPWTRSTPPRRTPCRRRCSTPSGSRAPASAR